VGRLSLSLADQPFPQVQLDLAAENVSQSRGWQINLQV
jgi:hypothetical protein